MVNNIQREDLDCVIEFLKTDPILTQSKNVQDFEKEWSDWLKVKYSVFVNSGSSANILTIAAMKHIYGDGEVILPALTWVSDISAVLFAGLKPVFVDINPKTLCMDEDQVFSKLNKNTKAVFITHAQGFNGLSNRLLDVLERKNIPLVEDVCESHGAEFKGQKLGSFGLVSNFSFYFAHHMSTVEGGMISTNDENIYQTCLMLRSHGMAREVRSESLSMSYIENNPELHPEFIFIYPAYNMRNTEIGAVFGRNQLKRLDSNNIKRQRHFKYFLENLDSDKFQTDFELAGSCNYAFNLILKKPDHDLCNRVMNRLREANVEFRRGSAGGGNQLRQPYLSGVIRKDEHKNYPVVEHVHFFGFYIGNYPGLTEERIKILCDLLNSID